MSLHIYTSVDRIPSDLQYIRVNDVFFDSNTLLPKNKLCDLVLSTVDHAVYNSDLTFISRTKELGALNKSMLSTGTKTFLNILCSPDTYCFDVLECGSNVLQLIPFLKDGYIIWEIHLLLSVPYDKCDIFLDDEKHFTSFKDLLLDIKEEYE